MILLFDHVDVVLLDVRGVFVDDYWEKVLHGEGGLAMKFGLDIDTTRSVGEMLWEKYCRSPYRQTVEEAGRHASRDHIEQHFVLVPKANAKIGNGKLF